MKLLTLAALAALIATPVAAQTSSGSSPARPLSTVQLAAPTPADPRSELMLRAMQAQRDAAVNVGELCGYDLVALRAEVADLRVQLEAAKRARPETSSANTSPAPGSPQGGGNSTQHPNHP